MSLGLLQANPLITILMGLSSVTVSLGLMNLILTVIVEKAAEAREKDVQEVARQKAASQSQSQKDLLKICQKMDKDGSGTLSLNELLGAYLRSKEFRNLMTVMDISDQELQAIFRVADQQGAEGEMHYTHFCEEVFQLRPSDHRKLLGTLRLSILETQHMIQDKITSQLEKLAQQGDLQLAQIAHLDHKVDQLVLTSSMHRSQDADVQSARRSQDADAQSVHRSQDADGKENLLAELPVGHEGIDLCRQAIHNLALQTADMQAWRDLEQLQQEVQVLVDIEDYLINNAIYRQDFSLPNLTSTLARLVDGESQKDGKDINTIEVWIAEMKFNKCKSTLHSLSNMKEGLTIDSHLDEEQGTVLQTEGSEDIVSITKQVLFELKELLPHLLQMSTSAVPTDLGASCGHAVGKTGTNLWRADTEVSRVSI